MKELPLPFNFDEWDSFEDYEKYLEREIELHRYKNNKEAL
jgi:hypothetical protein